MLDSAPLAALLHARPAAVSQMTPWLNRHEAATSILMYAEVIEYLKSQPDFPRHLAALRTLLLAEVYPCFLTYAILDRYADIRRTLRPPHGPGLIGDIDTLIAATALERRLTLVTTDRDFERVPNLEIMLLTRAA